jgi:hypothetical protein
MSLPVYPLPTATPGLAYNVKWEPVFFNMPSAITATGASIDIALAATPLHNFELVYEFARDYFPLSGNTEFRTLFGFFLVLGGSAGRFAFSNPDDNVVVGQGVGTGNGSITTFTLTRTFVASLAAGVNEPIGIIDLTHTFPNGFAVNVYKDVGAGPAIVSPGAYNIVSTTPMNQQLVFTSAPASGALITIDMYYYYYCRFTDNKLTFNKFLNQIWDLSKVSIQSCRLGA